MDLTLLKTFVITARKGRLSHAANALNLTKSGVSLRLKRLEKDLGIELFERRPNRLLLTRKGKDFSERLGRLLDDLASAVTSVVNGVEKTPVNISIALGNDMGFFLGPHMAAFVKNNPGVRLSLLTRPYSEVLEMISEERLELGIGRFPHVHRSLETIPLLSMGIAAIQPRSQSALKQKKLSIDDLARQSLIVLTEQSTSRRAINEAFSKSGIVMKVAIEAGGCLAIKQFVRLGLGTGILHDTCIAKEEKKQFRIRDVNHLFGEWGISLVYKKNRHLTRAHQKLIAAITAATSKWKQRRNALFYR